MEFKMIADAAKGIASGLMGSEGIAGLFSTKDEKMKAKAQLDKVQADLQVAIENALIEREKLRVEENKAYLANIENARQREMQIATSEKASWITRNTTAILALGFVGVTLILYALSILKAVEIHEDILRDLRDIVILIMGYYFGSSIGSKTKQSQIDKMASNG